MTDEPDEAGPAAVEADGPAGDRRPRPGVELGKAAPLKLPVPPGGPGERKPTKAERLEAKAARLREQEAARRAAAARARTAGSAGRSGRPSRGVLVTLIVLSVVTLLLIAAVAVLVPTWLHQRHVNQARASALKSAKSYAVDFGSYNYQHLDADFAKVGKHLTPSFRKDYEASSSKLASAIVQYKGSSTATVQGAGVASVSTSKAVVVIFLDQTVKTSQSSTPRIDRNRLEVTLVRQHGTWLISELNTK